MKTLGNIAWNFNDLSMRFVKDLQEIQLRGLVASQFMQDTVKLRMIKGQRRRLILQMVVEDNCDRENLNSNTEVAELLRCFPIIFEEPQGLPLTRSYDHVIVLQERAQPINVRPYCYAYFQKD